MISDGMLQRLMILSTVATVTALVVAIATGGNPLAVLVAFAGGAFTLHHLGVPWTWPFASGIGTFILGAVLLFFNLQGASDLVILVAYTLIALGCVIGLAQTSPRRRQTRE